VLPEDSPNGVHEAHSDGSSRCDLRQLKSEESVFPYRSSSVITRFFEDCDTDYVHDGWDLPKHGSGPFKPSVGLSGEV
jgi:hypothetical protein